MSIIIVLWYRWLCKTKYGLRSSISMSAKNFRDDGKQFYTHFFITFGICFPVAYIAQTYLITIAAGLLFCIGIITGYNKNLKELPIQHVVHVFFAFIPISIFVLGLVFINLWYCMIIGLCLVPIINWLVKKDKDITRKVEYLVIYVAWVIFAIELFKEYLN